ncbi:hypothetical protein ED733_008006 [Metarhizium rileyi]|uniref:Uncharacterized protein n=1 Tax=Metarhizium rileyi (strain RCEF 4871) TaxID=1649241 RepID=A0A5C6GML2_METRR|nr:hypothetical protein ED733_008006 [Metarhizium rileyi]
MSERWSFLTESKLKPSVNIGNILRGTGQITGQQTRPQIKLPAIRGRDIAPVSDLFNIKANRVLGLGIAGRTWASYSTSFRRADSPSV